MKASPFAGLTSRFAILAVTVCIALAPTAIAQQVTFAPYLQLGDNGTFGFADQIVVAWQTNETTPNPSAYKVEFAELGRGHHRSVTPSARVVANYLAADPSLPSIPGAYGAHTNYAAVLSGLEFDAVYEYSVTGPGMPSGGFSSEFHTRKQGPKFSFAVVGDEGFFPTVPNSNPASVVDYEARIAYLINNADKLSLPNEAAIPSPEFIVNTGDNVYTFGSEGNYQAFFFPVYNSDLNSNESGSPILRPKLFLPVDGNHDVGSTGVNANLLASDSSPRFRGKIAGDTALSLFTHFHFLTNRPPAFTITS